MNFRRLLIIVGLLMLMASGFMAFMNMLLSPNDRKEQVEPFDLALVRVYENFLHRTKYSYDKILESGTNYNDQERVFVELTKKMIELKQKDPFAYEEVKKSLTLEVKKNQRDFKIFFQKISNLSQEEFSKLLNDSP